MTKKVLAGIVLGLAGLIALNWITTGEVTLIPSAPLSAEGREIGRLEGRFVAATHRLQSAERAAGATGMDTTSEAQAALDELNQVEKELNDLRSRVTSPSDQAKIDEILSNIKKVKSS